MDLLAEESTGAAVIVGVLAPWLIAVVNRPGWSSTVRSTVAVVVSVLLGVGVAAAAGVFDNGWVDVLGTCATVLATSQAVYGRLFAGSQRQLERLTSPRGGTMPPYRGKDPVVELSAGGRHHDLDGDGRADRG